MKRSVSSLFVYLVLTAAAVVVLYPLIYAVTSSLLTPAQSGLYPPVLLPRSLYLANFKDALALVPIPRFILNSTVVASAIMLGNLLTCSLAAYAFSFIRFFGRRVLFAIFLSTMMIPWEVTVIPNFLLIKSWGWMDSYRALSVPFLASAFGVFLLRQFFLQLPRELFEAARIDGCGHIRGFLSLALPLSRPALGTLGVYSFLHAWNMYLWPLLVTNQENMRTVQIGVAMLRHEEFTSWNLVLAGIVLTLLPSFALLALGLKQLVRGMTAGAVKG